MAEKVNVPDSFFISDKYPRYPWDEWLDGGVWKLEKGSDYKGQGKKIASSASHQGKNRNVKVLFKVVVENDQEYCYIKAQLDTPHPARVRELNKEATNTVKPSTKPKKPAPAPQAEPQPVAQAARPTVQQVKANQNRNPSVRPPSKTKYVGGHVNEGRINNAQMNSQTARDAVRRDRVSNWHDD